MSAARLGRLRLLSCPRPESQKGSTSEGPRAKKASANRLGQIVCGKAGQAETTELPKAREPKRLYLRRPRAPVTIRILLPVPDLPHPHPFLLSSLVFPPPRPPHRRDAQQNAFLGSASHAEQADSDKSPDTSLSTRLQASTQEPTRELTLEPGSQPGSSPPNPGANPGAAPPTREPTREQAPQPRSQPGSRFPNPGADSGADLRSREPSREQFGHGATSRLRPNSKDIQATCRFRPNFTSITVFCTTEAGFA